MQEEVENRTLTLVVSGTKFTGRLMKAAITKYLAHRKEKKLQKQKSRDTLLNIDGKGQAHTESVVAKSTRPSVLDNLKRPVQPRSTDKKPKQHEEVR